MSPVLSRFFDADPAIRYVALYRNGELTSAQRGGLANASASESDRYEELIVNPTLLTLVTQRGNIDCGGVEYVVIRYGSFYELVWPIAGGHLSIGVEPAADPVAVERRVRAVAVDVLGAARAA